MAKPALTAPAFTHCANWVINGSCTFRSFYWKNLLTVRSPGCFTRQFKRADWPTTAVTFFEPMSSKYGFCGLESVSFDFIGAPATETSAVEVTRLEWPAKRRHHITKLFLLLFFSCLPDGALRLTETAAKSANSEYFLVSLSCKVYWSRFNLKIVNGFKTQIWKIDS